MSFSNIIPISANTVKAGGLCGNVRSCALSGNGTAFRSGRHPRSPPQKSRAGTESRKMLPDQWYSREAVYAAYMQEMDRVPAFFHNTTFFVRRKEFFF